MKTGMDALEAMLATMRDDFLAEMPERCDALDATLLALEKSPYDKEIFMELFRQVHSLKGSGGTHGLPIITVICHHFEDLLSENDEQENFESEFVARALAYIALLRKVQLVARHAVPDYADFEAQLETLRGSKSRAVKSCLIVETSASMRTLYQSVLAEENLKITLVNNGLSALEFLLREVFDFVIIGRELSDMDGAALAATLRTTRGKNRDMPVILVTSNLAELPDSARLNVVLPRNNNLIEALSTSVKHFNRESVG